MNPNFRFLIASDQEREKVFCEIYYHETLFAEISQEAGKPIVVFFAPPDGLWQFSLDDLQDVLREAELHLLGV